MLPYILLFFGFIAITCNAYEPHRYKKLIQQTEYMLERQKQLVTKKLSLFSTPHIIADLDGIEQTFLTAAQKEFRKQLGIKKVLIEQRIENLHLLKNSIHIITSSTEERGKIDELKKDIYATNIKDKLDEIILQQNFIERQHMVRQDTEQRSFSSSTLSSLNDFWSRHKRTLEDKLNYLGCSTSRLSASNSLPRK